MKNLFVFAFLGMILFAESCTKSSDQPGPDPISHTPLSYLQEGAVWTYINSDTDTSNAGNTFETSYSITGFDAHGYCYVDWQTQTLLQKLTWYVDTGQWADQANKINGDKFTLIKANPKPGDTSYLKITTGNPVTKMRVVMSLLAKTTVPAGTFSSCALVHETTSADPKYYEDYWIDRDYGIVRMEGTTKDVYPVKIIQELKAKPF